MQRSRETVSLWFRDRGLHPVHPRRKFPGGPKWRSYDRHRRAGARLDCSQWPAQYQRTYRKHHNSNRNVTATSDDSKFLFRPNLNAAAVRGIGQRDIFHLGHGLRFARQFTRGDRDVHRNPTTPTNGTIRQVPDSDVANPPFYTAYRQFHLRFQRHLPPPRPPSRAAAAVSGLADNAADMSMNWNLYNGRPDITQYAQPSATSAVAQDGSPAAQLMWSMQRRPDPGAVLQRPTDRGGQLALADSSKSGFPDRGRQ